MNKITPVTWAVLACLSLPLPAAAQETAPARQAATQDTALPSVNIKARRETATGPVKGYLAGRSATATKTDTLLAETPQAITVITRDAIEDQGALTAAETVRYAAGVNSAYFDSRVDSFQTRGGTPAQYLDGLLRTAGNYNTTRPDPYTLERVEVLRGPSSVLYGQGGIGGVLNMVSKRPQREARREVQMQVGNHNRRQIAADLTGPLDSGGTWLYRLVAVGRDSGSQVDHVPNDRFVLAPSLTWAPNADTELTLQALYQKDKSGSLIEFFPWKGTLYANPAGGQIPFNTFISEPGFDKYDTEQKSLGYQFSHRINPAWTVRQNLRLADSDVDYYTIYTSFTANTGLGRPARPVFDSNGRTVRRDIVIQLNSARLTMLDNQSEFKFNTGAVGHTLLLGLDLQRAVTEQATGRGVTAPFDVYAPVYGTPYTIPTVTAQPKTTQRQLGFYAQDQIKVGQRWAATLGLRHDKARTEVEGKPLQGSDSSATTGRAGLVYLGESGWNPYISYSESFLPLTGVDFYGKAFKPQRGSQWEAGVKYQPADANVMYSLAVYDLYDKNRKTTDPANPSNSIQVGKVRVRGLELEARGALSSQWELAATYAFTIAKIDDSNARSDIYNMDGQKIGSVAEEGTHLSGTPQHMASAWLSYSMALGSGRLKVGAGLRHVGASTDGTNRNEVPAVNLVDAMVAYDTGDWRLALNLNNLANKEYLTTCLSRGDCFLGQKRTMVATASYRF